MQENPFWLLPCMWMAFVLFFMMEDYDYHEDVFVFTCFVTFPIIFGFTTSADVQAFIAQWQFAGAFLVLLFDAFLLVTLSMLLYLALDYDDFIPFRD